MQGINVYTFMTRSNLEVCELIVLVNNRLLRWSALSCKSLVYKVM